VVRLHYVYPYPHVDQIIALMNEEGVLPYLDIPFQHGSPSVLKRMRRPAHAENTLERIARWRAECPQLTIRSTFIVGFPGESEAEFEELLAWLAMPSSIGSGASSTRRSRAPWPMDSVIRYRSAERGTL